MVSKFGVVIINIILAVLSLFFSEKLIIDFGYWLYLIQFIIFFFFGLNTKNNFLYFFSPSFLTITYLGLNFFMGHYVVSNNLGLTDKYFNQFVKFQSVNFITFYFLLCNLIVFLSIPLKKMRKYQYDKNKLNKVSKNTTLVFSLLFFMIIVSFIYIDLSFIGGGGNFNYVYKLSSAIILMFLIKHYGLKKRVLFYLLFLLIFVLSSFESKREIIYVLILILIVESFRYRINFNLSIKKLILYFCSFFLLFEIIIVSSIMRGYGNYNIDNPVDAISYSFDYLQSDFAKDVLVENFELSAVYGSSSIAVNYVYSDEVGLLYGSTFLKFLFIPIPRSILPNKPKSMVKIYTDKFDPKFSSIGGTNPIIIYSELFWNFSLFGFFFLYIIYYFFNRAFLKLYDLLVYNNISLKGVFILYMYVTFIQFVRGSGFDLWLLYALLSLPFLLIVKLLKLRNINN